LAGGQLNFKVRRFDIDHRDCDIELLPSSNCQKHTSMSSWKGTSSAYGQCLVTTHLSYDKVPRWLNWDLKTPSQAVCNYPVHSCFTLSQVR
jgi:uncharacterized protein (DUF427 family)